MTARLLLWSHGQRSAVARIAEDRGYEKVRTLWQLRRSLSDVPDVDPPPGVRIRPFVPGQDEETWLAVNAAAFATHPEQGGGPGVTLRPERPNRGSIRPAFCSPNATAP